MCLTELVMVPLLNLGVDFLTHRLATRSVAVKTQLVSTAEWLLKSTYVDTLSRALMIHVSILASTEVYMVSMNAW
jgi:hypothetical protein